MLVSIVKRQLRHILCVLGVMGIFLSDLKADVFDSTLSVRGVGMGGAYAAVVNNADALFYNPAGLSRAGMYWTIADPNFGIGNTAAILDLVDSSGSSSGSFADTLSGIYGEPVWLGGGAKTAIVFPFFGAAYYQQINFELLLENPVYPNLNVKGYWDKAAVMGFAFPIVPGFVYGGVNIRRVSRMGADTSFTGATLSNLDADDIIDQIQNKSMGYGVDFGMNLVIPAPFVKPIFSFVWKNVGTTSYRSENSSISPPSDKEDMIIAAAVEMDVPLVKITPSIEFRGLNNTDEQIGKKIHMGLELDLPLLAVRGGFYQGYYTAGLGLGLGPLSFDLATYAVERGAYPGQHEDRRFVFQLAIDIGVGIGFNIFDNSKAGPGASPPASSSRYRKLKVRR